MTYCIYEIYVPFHPSILIHVNQLILPSQLSTFVKLCEHDFKIFKNVTSYLYMVECAYNPTTWEAEAEK